MVRRCRDRRDHRRLFGQRGKQQRRRRRDGSNCNAIPIATISPSCIVDPSETNLPYPTATTTYPSSKTILAAISLSSDNVFGDNTNAQIAQQTPTMSGSAAAGYTASAVIGLAL